MVIVVIGILAAVTVPVLVNSFRAYETNQTNLVTLSKLRYATERMAREIRDVQYTGGAYAIVMGPTTLQFTKNDAAGTVVTIAAAPPLVTLQYSTPAMTATLTDQVAANGLQFLYYDINNNTAGVTAANVAYVDVDLTLTDPNSGAAQQRTRIALRNR
jgi:type II secretory pathway pseudopilin PulG